MYPIQSRDEVVNFVTSSFDYLTEKGFQIVEVEFSNTLSWAVIFEGECRIRISWYWHDGMSIMISKPGVTVEDYRNCYSLDTLVFFLRDKEVVEKFYDDMMADKSDYNVQVYSALLSMYLDEIIELIAGELFGKHDRKLKQLRRTLDKLLIEKYVG